MKRSSIKGLAVVAAVMASACGGPAVDAPQSPAARALPLNTIASLTLASGATVAFHEPLPGEVLVDVTATNRAAFDDVAAIAHGAKAVATFEKLAGRAAPQALVDAQRRADAKPLVSMLETEPPVGLRADRAPADRARPVDPPGIGRRASAVAYTTSWGEAHNSTTFFNKWCTKTQNNVNIGVDDFHLCWLNAVSLGSTMRYTTSMGLYAGSQVGTARVRFFGWEYNWGKVKHEWVQYFNVTIPPGTMRSVFGNGGHRWRYMETSPATGGNVYHATIYGDYP